MPVVPPYLYAQSTQSPSQYSLVDSHNDFDPKAFTRASWTPEPSQVASRTEGSYLNFNRHPDSYVFVPHGQTDAVPMGGHIKKTVKIVRWTQFSLRAMQMLGALGLLFCVICIKNTAVTEGYIIRVPAGVDILTTGYALYHLQRPAKGRTPASSSSYHIFATIIDVSLIPFYVFTILATRSNSALPSDDKDRWTSFFNAEVTEKIALATWLISVTVGGLHVITAGVCVYLAHIFRKISHLPPDLNPLEDNLTSRRRTKHKYKNSEISASSGQPTLAGSTLDLSKSGRSSPVKDSSSSNVRPVPFLHTRTNSDQVYSPHNPITAEALRSATSIPPIPNMYRHPDAVRASASNLPSQLESCEKQSEAGSKRSHGFMSEPSSHIHTLSASSSVYSATSTKTSTTEPPTVPRKSSKRLSLVSDNWFVHDSGHAKENKEPQVSVVDEEYEPDDSRSLKKLGKTYQPVPQQQQDETWLYSLRNFDNRSRDSFIPVPLGMNPPTPEPEKQHSPGRARPLSTMSGNSSLHNTPKKSVATPKSKYYGDLNAALEGVRGASPTPSPNAQKYRNSPEKRDWASKQDGGRKGRVISRSGADNWIDGVGQMRGRHVSGKAAEEGRAGVGWRAWGQ